MTGSGRPLAGLGILVTRPAHQADGLCRSIEELGGTAYRFPVLAIEAPRDPAPLAQIAERLDDYQWAIFISVNAVQRALTAILASRPWPASVRVAVIGRRSAEEIKAFGLQIDLCPHDRFDSEALLALPPMQAVTGQRVVIFRGEGGREHLADTLRKRGAIVDYVESYRRVRPQADSDLLVRQWRNGCLDVVLVNSIESLHNLKAMLGEDGVGLLQQAQLLVVSERLVPAAKALGVLPEPILAANATDDAVLEALLAWRSAQAQ